MKKIVLTLVLLIFSVLISLSQTIVFHENFELPSLGDSVISSGNPGWQIGTYLHKSGLRCDTSKVASDDTSLLTTNTIITTGYSNVILQFSHICKIEFQDNAIIQVSNNNGVTWTQLTGSQYLGSGQFTSNGNKFASTSYADWLPGTPIVIPTNSWWKTEQFDISSLAANSTQIRIRFMLFDGNGTGAAGNYGWLIDDIIVSGSYSELVPPAISLNTPILQDTVFNTGPFNISATITDASGIAYAKLVYKLNNAINYDTIAMINTIGNIYNGIIPNYTYNNKIWYHIIAKDNSPAHNIAIYPSIGDKWFYIKKGPSIVIIGSGSEENQHLPIEPYWNYSYSQTIYKNNYINNSGTVTKLYYYCNNGGAYGPDAIKVYMTQTSKTSFTSTSDWFPLSNLTLVYNGNISVPATASWVEIPLTTPFEYDGIQNLVICVDENTNNHHSINNDFYCSNMNTDNKSIYFYSDTQNPDPAAPPTTGTNLMLSTYNPNLKLEILTTNYAQDAGVTQITEPTGIIIAGTVLPVRVKIENFGDSTLHKATIKWKIDGIIQSQYIWYGSLPADITSSAITIANKSFLPGNHVIKAWTELPNDSIDNNNVNDTATVTVYACSGILNGNYTIGGSGADYPTFTAALTALHNCGINGPVVFNVNTGTYNEQLSISEISGTSVNNTVTFQSAIGNNNDVRLLYSSVLPASNYTLKLNGADNLIFKNISIVASGSMFGRVVDISGIALNNKFIGNKIIGNATTSLSDEFALIYSYGMTSLDSCNIFDGNTFLNGSYGMYYSGINSSLLENKTIITNNIFTNQNYRAIYLYYQNAPVINGNIITTYSLNSSFEAIYTANCDKDMKIEKNKIYIPNGGTGINILFSDGTSSKRGLIANNFISILSNSDAYGIHTFYTTFQNIYYNNINIASTDTTEGKALYTYLGCSSLNIINNIFANTGGGYAFYSTITSGGIISNHNNLFTTGTKIGYWGMDCSNLANWQTASTQDANSKSVNPVFTSPSDLHISSPALNNAAAPVAAVTDDIDGQVRDAFTPDIGADEFTPSSVDLATTELVTPQLTGCYDTNQTVIFRIKNFGTDTLDLALYNAVLNSSIAGINPQTFTTTISTGIIAPYATKDIVVTNTYDMSSNGLYTFKAYINVSGDGNILNDTLPPVAISNNVIESFPYSVDFSATPSPSWTITQLSGSGNWTVKSGAMIHPPLNPVFGTGMLFFDSYTFASGTKSRIVTPTIDLTSLLNPKLQFWFSQDAGFSSYLNEGITVRISTDGGISWINDTLFVSRYNASYSTPGWIKITKSLSAYTSYPCVKIAFDANGRYGNNFSIDKVEIVEIPLIDAGVTSVVSPDMNSCVPTGQVNLSVVVENFGLQTINGPFNISYIIDNNSSVTQIFTDTIALGVKDTFYFSVPLNNTLGNHILKVFTSVPFDNPGANDSLIISYTAINPFILPYLNTLNYSVSVSDFCINNGSAGEIIFLSGAANTGAGGLAFGSFTTSGWNVNTDTITSSLYYVWNDNVNPEHKTSARLIVNTAAYANLKLKFDLKQLFNTSNSFTNFRILVNGTQITKHFQPNGANTSYNTYEYDLAPFLPADYIFIDFQSKDYSNSTYNLPNGNGNFIDNIRIFEPPAQEGAVLSIIEPATGCGLGFEAVKIKIKNTGSDTINGNITASYKLGGNFSPVTENVPNIILPGDTLNFIFATTTDFTVTSADSLFELTSWINLAGDTVHTNDTVKKDVLSGFASTPPVALNDTIPYGTSTILTATSSDSIFWYDVPAGGAEIATGTTYTTPVLFDTTNFYVESRHGFPSIKITEVTLNRLGAGATNPYPAWCTGADLIEISNVGSATANLHNYVMEIYGTGARAYLLPDINLFAGEVLILNVGSGIDNPTHKYYNMGGINDVIYSSSPSGFVLKDSSGAVVDAVASNGYVFLPASGVTTVNWSGNITATGYAGIIRVISDNNNASDWIVSSSTNLQTLGLINPAFGGAGGLGCPSNRIPVTVFVTGSPQYDAGVQIIYTPSSGIDLTNTEQVKIKIINYGTSVISNFPVSYKINNNPPVTENVNDSLYSGDTLIFTFSSTADLTAYSSYSIISFTSLAGDYTTANDTAYKTVINNPLTYCISSAIQTIDDDIGNVTFAGINNSSPQPYNGTYTDYTNLPPAQIFRGLSYPMSINIVFDTGSTYSGYCEAYIDWNKDGVLSEPSEIVFGGAYNGFDTLTGNIIVPQDAVIGITRMRIVAREYGTAATVTPCGTYSWGETEDYFVRILYPIPEDAGVVEILQPASSVNEAVTVPVKVLVKNFGIDTIFNTSNMQVEYKLNGGTAVSSLWNIGSLPPLTTDTIDLPNFTVPPGNNNICAYTVLTGDTNTFNDQLCKQFYGVPLLDAGIIKILQPGNVLTLGVSEPVELIFKNFGINTITSMSISYVINGTSPISQTWTGNLLSNATDTVILTNFIVPSSSFTICTYTSLTGDSNTANDTLCKSVYVNSIESLPYLTEFEYTVDTWYDSSSTQAVKWERGIPASSIINSAHSPDNVWKTNLDGDYVPSMNDYLYSPVFNVLPSMDTLTLSFWHWYITQSNTDGGRIEYSIDGGNIWITLGYMGDPLSTNWYNSSANGKLFWSGNSSGWIESKYKLPKASFNNFTAPIRFRFNFFSDAYANYNGWAIDDFSLTLTSIYKDAGVIEITQPTVSTSAYSSVPVTVKIKNFGIDTLYNIPVAYMVSSGTPVTSSWIGILAPNDVILYSFATNYISPDTNYKLCAYTSLAQDSHFYNDTTCNTLSVTTAQIDAGIDSISKPVGTVTNTGISTTVAAYIKNYGGLQITSVPVSYTVNGGNPITETWAGTLNPGDKVQYTFTTTYLPPSIPNYTLCVKTALTNDIVTTNDQKCKQYSTVGIEEDKMNGIYLSQNQPNPANSFTSIEYETHNNGEAIFTLVNTLGQVVYKETKNINPGHHQIILDLRNIESGLYSYSLEFNNIKLYRKMIISK